MDPEVADAIRIADKHLAGEAVERRKALAQEIVLAICRHAGVIAAEAIKTAEKTVIATH